MNPYPIRITDAQIKRARSVSNGSIPVGIRCALDRDADVESILAGKKKPAAIVEYLRGVYGVKKEA